MLLTLPNTSEEGYGSDLCIRKWLQDWCAIFFFVYLALESENIWDARKCLNDSRSRHARFLHNGGPNIQLIVGAMKLILATVLTHELCFTHVPET